VQEYFFRNLSKHQRVLLGVGYAGTEECCKSEYGKFHVLSEELNQSLNAGGIVCN
jgi:hypothetical protein